MHVEGFSSFDRFNGCEFEDVVQALRYIPLQSMYVFTIDRVVDDLSLSPPRDGVTVIGLDGDRALATTMSNHVIFATVGREDLERGDDGGFAAVVGTYQNGKACGRFDDRVPM